MTKSPKFVPQKERPSDEKSVEVISTEALRRPAPNVIDQRQQQIDPAGRHRVHPDARPGGNSKQPGGSGMTSPQNANHGDGNA